VERSGHQVHATKGVAVAGASRGWTFSAPRWHGRGPPRKIGEQSIARSLVLAGALMKPKNRFMPHFIDPQGRYQVLMLDFHTVQK